MRFINRIVAGLLLTCGIFAQEIEPLQGWTDNLKAAQAEAQERSCPLLIAFLGPNWCEYSDKLEEEILTQKAFSDQLKEDFVFVRIDIPEDFDEGDYFGKSLKEKYGVEECPSVVMATGEGEAIAKLDYLPITCSHFASYVKQVYSDYMRVSHLARRELRQMKADEIQHLYARAGRLADTTFKQALMKQGLKVDRGPYFLVEEYGNLLASGAVSERKLNRLRSRVVARDPQNEQGCLRKLALIDFQTRTEGKTPEQVIQPLVQYLTEFGPKDPENAWRLEMKISQYLFSRNQIESALKHAKLCYDLAPKEAQKEIAQSIEYLQSFVQ